VVGATRRTLTLAIKEDAEAVDPVTDQKSVEANFRRLVNDTLKFWYVAFGKGVGDSHVVGDGHGVTLFGKRGTYRSGRCGSR
jgi:hypothetical protein